MKGKENRWKHAACVTYNSITSTGVCLWQPWTGQEDWQADRFIISTKCSLWEDISASTALSTAVRETWGGKHRKINSRGKINWWWIFSLLSNIKRCKLFNLTRLMSRRVQDPAGADTCWKWPKGEEENESASQKQKWRKRCCCLSVKG